MPMNVQQLTNQGRDALMRLDRDAAEAAFAQALEEDPESVDALGGLGQVAYERGELEKSRVSFTKAVTKAKQQLGGNWPTQLDFFTEPQRSFLRAIHGMGLIFFRLGKKQEAQKWFELERSVDASDHQGSRFLLTRLKSGKDWRGQ